MHQSLMNPFLTTARWRLSGAPDRWARRQPAGNWQMSIRDARKREVDFVVIRDDIPWFLVEVKYATSGLSPTLAYFQNKTGAQHAFQVTLSADYVDADCFTRHTPTIVPARTLLSQLL